MAEKKVQKKDDRTLQYQQPKETTSTPKGSYYNPDEDDLAGVSVFGGYVEDRHQKLPKGVAGPIRRQRPIDKTASGMLRTLLNKPKGDKWVVQLQEALFRAGFYGNASRKDIAWGQPRDADTIAAYKNAILSTSSLNASGRMVTVPAFLKELGDTRDENGLNADDAGRDPFSPVVDNPEDIKNELNEALPRIMGRSVDASELDEYVKLFQSLQTNAQRRAYDTQEAGGSTTQPMSIESFARQQAQTRHPDEYGARQLADKAKELMAMFGESPQTARF